MVYVWQRKKLIRTITNGFFNVEKVEMHEFWIFFQERRRSFIRLVGMKYKSQKCRRRRIVTFRRSIFFDSQRNRPTLFVIDLTWRLFGWSGGITFQKVFIGSQKEIVWGKKVIDALKKAIVVFQKFIVADQKAIFADQKVTVGGQYFIVWSQKAIVRSETGFELIRWWWW